MDWCREGTGSRPSVMYIVGFEFGGLTAKGTGKFVVPGSGVCLVTLVLLIRYPLLYSTCSMCLVLTSGFPFLLLLDRKESFES